MNREAEERAYEERREQKLNTVGLRGNRLSPSHVKTDYPELRVKLPSPLAQKSWFTSKKYGDTGFSLYKSAVPKCGLYLTGFLPENLEGNKYEGSYIFCKRNNSLFYVHNHKPLRVKIDNNDLLTHSVMEIMETKTRIFERQHLSKEKIYTLITSNGGHNPKNPLENILVDNPDTSHDDPENANEESAEDYLSQWYESCTF